MNHSTINKAVYIQHRKTKRGRISKRHDLITYYECKANAKTLF
jgi:hypothetical protein